MSDQILETILSCPTLPSLPAVAVRVIELTSREDVSLDELAATIQHDQALATKVLRTVNSSFFGLRQRCTTIDRALVMLGLGPVKSLALGFSLVSALGEGHDEHAPFDYVAYWRRGLYTAVSAKCIAQAAKVDKADEAFLGGLLQDIGMIAMCQGLGLTYLRVLGEAKDDHRALIKCELEHLDVQHPDVGAMLAERWNLPEELVLPIKYHERPTASPPACADIVRSVALGNILHDVLTDEDSTPPLRELYKRAEQWFKLDTVACDEIVEQAGLQVREIANLFKLNTGSYTDPIEVLDKARERLVGVSREAADDAPNLAEAEQALETKLDRDPLTGVFSRSNFDQLLDAMFTNATGENDSMSIVEVVVEGLDRVTTDCGREAADEILLGVAALLRMHFEPTGAIVARISQSMFGVAVRGMTQLSAVRAAEVFRTDIEKAAGRWKADLGAEGVGVSIGVACAEQLRDGAFASASQVLAAATKAAITARQEGGNCVRSFVAQKSAA